MPEYTVNGLQLHYEERGDPTGAPAVLLPGLGGNHLTWGPVARRLASRYRLVLLDPRDAGQSARAPGPYTVADLAGDVAALLRHLGLATACVVGLSMGGAVAQELAIARPDLVKRLALIATYDAGDPRGTAIFQHFARLRRILSRDDYHRTLLPWVYTHQEYQRVISPEEAVQRLSQDPFFQEPEAYERQVQATISFQSRDRLDRIACPTLLIFGDEDLFTPMRFARSLHAGIEGSRLVVLAGAGHGLVWTRTAEVASLIDGFFQEPEPASPKEAP
ncbi:MAG: alpha/beta fold hydrolase [Dehalococcoidia bacterium]